MRSCWPAVVIAVAVTVFFHLIVAVEKPDYWTAPIWDEGYYHWIATDGYQSKGEDYFAQTNVCFSPGYPMVLRALHGAVGVAPAKSRLVVSAICFLIACIGLWRLYEGFQTDRLRNAAAIAYFALWPGSFYFLSGYAENLYLPLAVWCCHSLVRRRYLLAALLAGSALFTRSPAIILAPTIALTVAVHMLSDSRPASLRELTHCVFRWGVRMCIYMPICGLGLAGYMLMLWSTPGIDDPLAFLKGYVSWIRVVHHGVENFYLEAPYRALAMYQSLLSVKLSVWFFMLTPVVVMWQRRRLPLVLVVFTTMGWMFFLAQFRQQQPFLDMLRWSAIFFPVHYCLAGILDRPASYLARVLPHARLIVHLGVLAVFACVYWYLVARYLSIQWVS
ncbi:MAG: mannosyltransferase family protein [Planctomycetota bacterium]